MFIVGSLGVGARTIFADDNVASECIWPSCDTVGTILPISSILACVAQGSMMYPSFVICCMVATKPLLALWSPFTSKVFREATII